MPNTFQIKYKNIYKPVDIIIAFHGNYHLLSECIESLVRKTLGILYTITLVDDGSPNQDFIADLEKKKLRRLPLQYIRHTEQKGFGAALQTGFENTLNDWVLFLHADCRIEQTDWLLNMQQAMHDNKEKGVKLVSAKTNDGGTGSYDSAIIGSVEKTKNVIAEDPLPLICALAHRHLFAHIDGFVKPYPYGWYEDEELFWRMKLMGFKQMVCGSSYVFHHGGATIKELMKDQKVYKVMEANRDTYISDIRALAK